MGIVYAVVILVNDGNVAIDGVAHTDKVIVGIVDGATKIIKRRAIVIDGLIEAVKIVDALDSLRI